VKDAKLDLWDWHDGQLGIACGQISGITVLDIDVCDDTSVGDVLQTLTRKDCPMNNVVRTPSGGLHIYLAYEPSVTNRVRVMGMPLDVRTDGGYVIAPTWGDYRVLRWDFQFKSMPEGVRRPLIRKPIIIEERQAHESSSALEAFVVSSNEGERNQRLFWAACRMIEAGNDPGALMQPALSIGLDQKEIEKTIKSAIDNTSRSV